MVSRFAPVLTMSQPKRSDDPVVARGQDAWEQLQEDAPRRRALSRGAGDKARERRERSQDAHRRWWVQVGEALAAGKHKCVSNQSFSAWVTGHGFDEIGFKIRQDAIWLAANMETLGELPDDMASPTVIRRWANKRAAVASGRANGDRITDADVAALQKAAALLRESARDARRSAAALDEAARLIGKVNIAIKRRV